MLGRPGTGWDLHELRHSALTHLGEGGASLLMLMAKSRHKKTENLRRYFHPSPDRRGHRPVGAGRPAPRLLDGIEQFARARGA